MLLSLPRLLLPGAALAVTLSTSAVAQDEDALLEFHRSEALFARQLDIARAWGEAEEDTRTKAQAMFSRVCGRSVPMAYAPPLGALADAAALLGANGARTQSPALERRAAYAIDLRVEPGAFGQASLSEDPGIRRLGEPLVVHVSLLGNTALPDRFELSLRWISPEGGGTRARTEEFDAESLKRGFEMYVRSPVTTPGLWHLVPELASSDGIARGFPVPVECVGDLDALSAGFLEGAPDELTSAYHRRMSRFLELVAQGIRGATWPSLDALARGEPTSLAQEVAFDEFPMGRRRILGIGPSDGRDVSRTIVLTTVTGERLEWVFTGEAGRAWRALADEAGVAVFATDLPVLVPTDEPAGTPSLLDLLRFLRRLDDHEVTLIVRGRSLTQLGVALEGVEPPFDRLVASTLVAPGRDPLPIAALPTLYVGVLAETAGERLLASEPAELRWLSTPDPPFVADRVLADHLRGWMDR